MTQISLRKCLALTKALGTYDPWPTVPQALVSAKHFPQLSCVMQQ